jgi:hypothetical protein
MTEPSKDQLDPIHNAWTSRYFAEHSGASPSMVALTSGGKRLCFDAVILSLADRVEVVALRILLALSRVPIRELRSGLADEQFPPFTTAVGRFVSSPLQIHTGSRSGWQQTARRVIEKCPPRLLVIEGLRFGTNNNSPSSLSGSAEVVRYAAINGTGLLLSD